MPVEAGTFRRANCAFFVVWPVDESGGECGVATRELSLLWQLSPDGTRLHEHPIRNVPEGEDPPVEPEPRFLGADAIGSWTIARSSDLSLFWRDCDCDHVLIYFDAPGSVVEELTGIGFQHALMPSAVAVYSAAGDTLGQVQIHLEHFGLDVDLEESGKSVQSFRFRGNTLPEGGQLWPRNP